MSAPGAAAPAHVARVPTAQLDHLVVAARTLAEGAAWCEATLGVVPQPGGRHAGIGTHNRLLAVAGAAFPRSYLEIIAIDADAPAPAQPRWFDLDDAALQRALESGPRLVHWVARAETVDAVEAMRDVLATAGHDPGEPIAAERQTPAGALRWTITRRGDGVRQAAGAVPSLIAWSSAHPADVLPASGVELQRVMLGGVAAAIASALGVEHDGPADAPPLAAVLRTPRGTVRLESPRSMRPA